VNRGAACYRGEGKTDAKDAAIIASQARMRCDLRELRLEGEMITELRMLTTHRADLAADRTRAINRLRGRLIGIFPALEQALDFTNHGPLVLVSNLRAAASIRAAGPADLDWLRSQRVRGAAKPAGAAIRPASGQQTRIGARAWPPRSSPGWPLSTQMASSPRSTPRSMHPAPPQPLEKQIESHASASAGGQVMTTSKDGMARGAPDTGVGSPGAAAQGTSRAAAPT
jgi:Transposase